MAEDDSTIWRIIGLILIIFLLAIVFLSIYMWDIPELARSWIGFEEGNLSVKWSEEIFLEDPGVIQYLIGGKNANIYLKYNPEKNNAGEIYGWMWGIEKRKDKRWFRSSTQDFIEFKKLSVQNQEFLIEITGKSPEDGLIMIANRVLKNDEGNYWFDVNLVVSIGEWVRVYNKRRTPKELKDIDGLILKFNQISRGVVK